MKFVQQFFICRPLDLTVAVTTRVRYKISDQRDPRVLKAEEFYNYLNML
jgi:hypothetical protein